MNEIRLKYGVTRRGGWSWEDKRRAIGFVLAVFLGAPVFAFSLWVILEFIIG
jgi:hypothetical protein